MLCGSLYNTHLNHFKIISVDLFKDGHLRYSANSSAEMKSSTNPSVPTAREMFEYRPIGCPCFARKVKAVAVAVRLLPC
jgi:hypothetical protein